MIRILNLTLLLVFFFIGFNVLGQKTSCDSNELEDKLIQALADAIKEPEQSLLAISSLLSQAEKENDRNSIHLGYIALGKYYLIINQYDEALLSANQAYLNATEIGAEQLINESVLLLSQIHLLKDIKAESLEYLYKGLELSLQLRDSSSISWYLIQIPEVEQEVGNIGRAMEYALKAKSFFESTGDDLKLGNTLLNLGNIHQKLGNLPLSRENFARAIRLIETQNDSLLLGKVKLSFTNLLLSEGKVNEAEDVCLEAINLFKSISYREYLRAQSKLGEIVTLNRKYQEATNILLQTLKAQERENDISGQAFTLHRLAKLYQANQQIDNAIKSYKDCISLSLNTGLNDLTRLGYKGLSQVLGSIGNYNSAFVNLNHYTRITDSLFNIQKISEASKLEETYKYELHQVEIQSKVNELILLDQRLNQQRQKQIFLYIAMFLFIGLAIFAFREFRNNKKAIEKLALQKEELEEKKDLADKRTRDFTDSLNYAKRIQQAILRASLKISDLFSDAFIILFPRNIVSGDFFWVKERSNRILFALADCTGHGVPGALMSIIGTYGLNRFADEMGMTCPTDILVHLNALFEESFEQKEGVEIFDGMDIALCSYNPKNKELIYAGANIPFYILRESNAPQPTRSIAAKGEKHTLYFIKPNKQPVGSYFYKKPFINHSITLQENDIIYLFTDGFYDQFGGPEGRKYKTLQLYSLLCSFGSEPLEKQKEILENTFKEWKGNRNQIDDVSFMGIKI